MSIYKKFIIWSIASVILLSSVFAYDLTSKDKENGMRIIDKILQLISSKTQAWQQGVKEKYVNALEKYKEKKAENKKLSAVVEYVIWWVKWEKSPQMTTTGSNSSTVSNNTNIITDTNSPNIFTLNWYTYWANADPAQVKANWWKQKLIDFVGDNWKLVFSNWGYVDSIAKKTFYVKYVSPYMMADSPNLEKSTFYYTQPKYYNPNISNKTIDKTKQVKLYIFGSQYYVWSKFEFEKLIESFRVAAESTSFAHSRNRTLTYQEIIYVMNSINGSSIDSASFSKYEAYYSVLPDYSILY